MKKYFIKKTFLRFHYLLSWTGFIVFGYLLLAPLVIDGFGLFIKGIYAAIFLQTDQFAWSNGTVIVISLFYFFYSVNAVLPEHHRRRKLVYLSDIATVLAFIFIYQNAYQIMLMMLAVGPWYLMHRWLVKLILISKIRK